MGGYGERLAGARPPHHVQQEKFREPGRRRSRPSNPTPGTLINRALQARMQCEGDG